MLGGCDLFCGEVDVVVNGRQEKLEKAGEYVRMVWREWYDAAAKAEGLMRSGRLKTDEEIREASRRVALARGMMEELGRVGQQLQTMAEREKRFRPQGGAIDEHV